MESDVVKVNCSFCGKEIECPKDMLNVEKHMCFNCFKEKGNSLKERDIEKIHVDIPRKEMEENLPSIMADAIMQELFPKIWSENKSEYKQLSRKELAKEMFRVGIIAAVETIKENDEELNNRNNDTLEKRNN